MIFNFKILKAESYEVKNLTDAVNPFDVFVIIWRDIWFTASWCNCLGVWSLFKSQVFSPQFFINVFYLVLQLKCHCFYDGSAYQGKCFQTGLLKYRYVNFWNFFLIRVMDNLLKEKRKYFSKLLKNTDNLFKLTCSLSLWSGLSIFFYLN